MNALTAMFYVFQMVSRHDKGEYGVRDMQISYMTYVLKTGNNGHVGIF